jgi:nitrogen fixation protein FixH
MSKTLPSERPLTGRHVLMITVGFFLAVFAVDGVFVYRAIATFPGEVSATAYEDGLAYDRTLAARDRSAALGWKVEVAAGAVPGRVIARISDAAGAPLAGLTVSGDLTRPATDAGRKRLEFRPLRPGVYQAEAGIGRGGWDLTLEARDGRGRAFEARRRLVWP